MEHGKPVNGLSPDYFYSICVMWGIFRIHLYREYDQPAIWLHQGRDKRQLRCTASDVQSPQSQMHPEHFKSEVVNVSLDRTNSFTSFFTTVPTLLPIQANGPDISTCMTKRALEEQWDHLVSGRFEDLNRDIKKTATIDGVANEVLLSELGWDLSKKKFEDLTKGKMAFSMPPRVTCGYPSSTILNLELF